MSQCHNDHVVPDVLESLHRHLPHAWVAVAGARGDAARVGHLVLEGVRPRGGAGRHRRVVVESVPEQGEV